MVSVVIPCYNEAENIGEIYHKLTKLLNPHPYEILFVDDGSSDPTLDIIKQFARDDQAVRYVSFSRNFGHQNALKAGIDLACGDCVISLDADMQHPPELIPELIRKWEEGYEVVYTVRDDRKNIGFFDRIASRTFYRLLNFFSETKIEPGSADFRLLDRKVVEELKKLGEHDLFLRGMVNWIGFQQYAIPFVPNKRQAGKTKYSLGRRIHLATAGITSFSTRPLKISIFFGFLFAFSAFLYGLYAIYEALFTDNTITGWASLIVSVLFIGGIQLIMIGIVGEYLGKLFLENKRRPNYIIRETNIKNEQTA
ncbi:MAG: glycosyltransferase family 2 protein [Chlorobi bacterium]|nr:glycosyltransferase family 2 protein [Chlorobiota bacterium]